MDALHELGWEFLSLCLVALVRDISYLVRRYIRQSVRVYVLSDHSRLEADSTLR